MLQAIGRQLQVARWVALDEALARADAIVRWQVGIAAQWARGHARVLRRAGMALLVPLVLCASVVTWTWHATPTPANLSALVVAADKAHHSVYTPFAQISPLVTQALIAAEDEHFYQHHGIDAVGLTRALWDDLRAQRWLEGGSTLTEQLAKNAYFGGDDHQLWTKWQDMVLSVKIEQRYSKAQILELYLNLVYFGDGAYGIGAASQHYFGISPAKLDLAQAALLVGLVQAPTAYDPWCAPAAAQTRQQQVLTRMLADGIITPTQAHKAVAESLPFWGTTKPAQHDAYCAV